MRIFYIAEILGKNLISRPLVKDLYTYIGNAGDVAVIIDFSNVEFATRSFIDEFYVRFFKNNENGLNTTLENVPYDIEMMFKAVKSTQNKKKAISNDIAIKTESIEDLEKHFSMLSI